MWMMGGRRNAVSWSWEESADGMGSIWQRRAGSVQMENEAEESWRARIVGRVGVCGIMAWAVGPLTMMHLSRFQWSAAAQSIIGRNLHKLGCT